MKKIASHIDEYAGTRLFVDLFFFKLGWNRFGFVLRLCFDDLSLNIIYLKGVHGKIRWNGYIIHIGAISEARNRWIFVQLDAIPPVSWDMDGLAGLNLDLQTLNFIKCGNILCLWGNILWIPCVYRGPKFKFLVVVHGGQILCAFGSPRRSCGNWFRTEKGLNAPSEPNKMS